MCVRMCPLTMEEAQAVLDARATPGAHAIRYIERPDPLRDARPGSIVPVYVPEGGGLAVARLTWGFPLDGKPNAVFNTRIESALEQLRLGRRGMWAKAITEGRCLVPVRAFYEGHMTERIESERTGRPVHWQAGSPAIPVPPPRRQGVPARRRARGRPVLDRHHQAEPQRGPGARPHAARAWARGIERVARPGLRRACEPRCVSPCV